MTTLEEATSVVTLTDGASVLMRDARCDDWEALRRMYLGLTDRTRYLYFCAGVPANDAWAGRISLPAILTIAGHLIGVQVNPGSKLSP